ncbi:MAG: hypothetical protein AAFR24_06665 [Cyanobacteria bacterium J06627_3]
MTAPIDMTGSTGTTTLETDFIAAPDLVKQCFIMAFKLKEDQDAYNETATTTVNNVALSVSPAIVSVQAAMPVSGADVHITPLHENVGDFAFTSTPLAVPGGTGDAATFAALAKASQQFAYLAAKLNKAETEYNIANPTSGKQGVEINVQSDSTVAVITIAAPIDETAKFYNFVKDYLA